MAASTQLYFPHSCTGVDSQQTSSNNPGVMAPTKLSSRYDSHHTHFIEQFTHKESSKRINKKPTPLSAKQRAALREQLKEVHFLKPDYADNTKINIAGILRKWKA
jgi:hypothetical protein